MSSPSFSIVVSLAWAPSTDDQAVLELLLLSGLFALGGDVGTDRDGVRQLSAGVEDRSDGDAQFHLFAVFADDFVLVLKSSAGSKRTPSGN